MTMKPSFRLAAVLSAAALLAGCATPRLASTPSESPPSAWQATLPHGGDAAALADWWRRFDDPLVAELVRDTQAANPTLSQRWRGWPKRAPECVRARRCAGRR
jgi:outer membrane protein, multidrug efflux system